MSRRLLRILGQALVRLGVGFALLASTDLSANASIGARDARIARAWQIRELLNARLNGTATQEDEQTRQAQWPNWYNYWPNWNNWMNWGNWHNW